MSRYRRVVWSEGMLLSPHHFQQADNYTEDLIRTRVAWLLSHEWGLLELQLNRDAVANGSVQLISCRGVMPDGLVVDIPQTCPAPEARPVGDHFPSTVDNLAVYLAVPTSQVGAANFQPDRNGSDGQPSSRPVRFLQEAGTVVDDTTGESEHQLAFARPNFKLL
ncbi:MAG TPA: type VI secretion system baseplate subunit TssK, partial [Blastocatellia bacterium]|nr:type VI secretion system baseplate subunit TssK [Blastocatellia bacterium]